MYEQWVCQICQNSSLYFCVVAAAASFSFSCCSWAWRLPLKEIAGCHRVLQIFQVLFENFRVFFFSFLPLLFQLLLAIDSGITQHRGHIKDVTPCGDWIQLSKHHSHFACFSKLFSSCELWWLHTHTLTPCSAYIVYSTDIYTDIHSVSNYMYISNYRHFVLFCRYRRSL